MVRTVLFVLLFAVLLAGCTGAPAAPSTYSPEPGGTPAFSSQPAPTPSLPPTLLPPAAETALPEPPPLDQDDLSSVAGRMAFALESKQPALLEELMNERGVALTLKAPGEAQPPGFDNRDQVTGSLAEAIENTTPLCTGYNPQLSTQPDGAGVVFHGIPLDWQALGASESQGDSVLFTLLRQDQGWVITTISPLYSETQLAQIGDPLPCPDSGLPGKSPQGEAVHIQQLKMFDSLHGWATNQRGQILRTVEGMQAWQIVLEDVPGGQYFQPTVYFIDIDTAVFLYIRQEGTSPTTLRTEDGGETWMQGGSLPEKFTPGLAPVELQFIDALHGWFYGQVYTGMHNVEVILFETTDGGLSWNLVHTSHPDYAPPAQMGLLQGSYSLPYGRHVVEFTSDTQGFAGGGSLFSTIDGGRYWVPITLPLPDDYPSLVQPYEYISPPWFSTPQDGFVLVRVYEFDQAFLPPGDLFEGQPKAAYIYITNDAGVSWTPYPAPALLGMAYFVDGSTGWFLSEEGPEPGPGALYRTTDGGKSWSLLHSTTPFPASARLFFLDEHTGWSLLSEADPRTGVSLYQTADGGQTWGSLVPRLAP